MTTDRARAVFLSQVDEALDRGLDPLQVESIQEWIVDHPSDGDEIARLLRRLESVQRAPRRAPRRMVPVAAAALVIASLVAALVIRSARDESARQDVPAPEVASQILHYSIEVVRTGADSSASVVVDAGRTTRVETTQLCSAPTGDASIGRTTIVSSFESRLP